MSENDPGRAETIGKRIARLRGERGWTQQALAARLAASRVAISHIEMDISLPSERTITLLAGIFKLTPFALVEGTTYPNAKAERLPSAVCSYTRLELDIALLDNDLGWLNRLNSSQRAVCLPAVQRAWRKQLHAWLETELDAQERETAQQALRRLEDFPFSPE